MSDFDALRYENEELRRRLAEAEQALRAIGEGQVDAIVVEGEEGAQVFSLTGSEHLYRVLIETMYESALTVSPEGTILFCNARFCELMAVSAEEVLGGRLATFASSSAGEEISRLLTDAARGPISRRLMLTAGQSEVPVQVSAHALDDPGEVPMICLVMADLTDLEASNKSITALRTHQREMEKAEAELRASRLAALNLMEDAVLARNALKASEEGYRALALENQRLYRQQLRVAEDLQSALLHIPLSIGPVRVGHLYRSATEAAQVGGDFYDVFEVKEGKIALLIGDVSGHGIQAARTATLVKDVVHAFAHRTPRPIEVVRDTNELLVEKGLSGFVTLFFGILDPLSGTLEYSSAGHPDVLLRRGEGEVHRLTSGGPPLGVFADGSWKTSEIEVEPGDLLFLYTDGITEARHNGDFFGEKRLEALVAASPVAVEGLPEVVLREVLAFSGGSLRDDLAILALSLHDAADRGKGTRRYRQEKLLR